MKIYLDDERKTPDGWVRTYTPKQTISYLNNKNIKVEVLSLDHDLGDDKVIGTGYDVLLWIEEQVATNNYIPPELILVHSANSSGKLKMNQAIRKIRDLEVFNLTSRESSGNIEL